MENANLTKELETLKPQVSKAVSTANSLVIKTQDDLVTATDVLGKIKIAYKIIKERMDAPIKRAYQAYKDIKVEQETTFGTMVAGCEEAERIVKSKMVAYQNIAVFKAEGKTEVIEKKVESGQMSFEKAAEKIEAITPTKVIEAKSGAIQFRTVKEVVIEDEMKLPREYLMPDIQKIKKVALAGVEIAGVKVVERQIVAGTTK